MQFITAAVAALVFAAPSLQTASPGAYVHNMCDFDVNVWSVVAFDGGKKTVIPANGGSYNETYRHPSIGGVSLKLTPKDTCADPTPITQLEYTSEASTIWYDLSDINCVNNGCPFKAYGMYMHSGEHCPSVTCPKGKICTGAYNAADDNQNSLSCPSPADLHLYLCASKAPTSGSSSSSGTTQKRHSHRIHHPHWRS